MGAWETNGYGKVVDPFWDNKEKSSGGGGADVPDPEGKENYQVIGTRNGAYQLFEPNTLVRAVPNSTDEEDVGKVLTKYGTGSNQYRWESVGGGGATVLPVGTDTNTLQKVLKYMIDNGKKLAFIPSMAFELDSTHQITCGRLSDTALSGGNGTIGFKDDSGVKYDIKLELSEQEIFFESVYVHLTYYDEGTYGYQLSYRRAVLQKVGNDGSLKIVKDSDGTVVNTNTFDNMNTLFGTSVLPQTFNDYLQSGIDITDCIKAIYGTIDYDGTTVSGDALRIFGDRTVSYVDIINRVLFKGSLILNLVGSGISYPTTQAYPTGAEVTDSTFVSANELNRVSSDTIEVYEENENIILV